VTEHLKSHYEKPAEMYDGLRLHQNENTQGCSPRVLDALARLTREQVGFYPPYAAATEAAARYLGVAADRVALVNGLDEGIMGAAIAYLRPSAASGVVPEAIVPEPAFEIFRFDTAVAGGRLVQVMPKPDFAFALDEVLAAITPATRIVFVTSPNNPTGASAPFDAIRAIAKTIPRDAIVFVDEAYAEFAGRSFIPELPDFPNVVVGRTFSKAFGLAAIRIGALVGAPEVVDPIRYVVPVYGVNIAAVVALQAALSDIDYLNDYLRQVKESKALLYAACDRLKLTYWRSDANFVLVRIGDRVGEVIDAARARGVFLRDRSGEPGCEGCLRFGAGVVEHTKRGIAVLEEALCAAR
jgi:histidinol-phosphate aminotransferase